MKNVISIISDDGKLMEIEVLAYFQFLASGKNFLVYIEDGTEEDETELYLGMINPTEEVAALYALSGKDLLLVKELINHSVTTNAVTKDIITLPLSKIGQIEVRTHSAEIIKKDMVEKIKRSPIGKIGIFKDGASIIYEHNPYSGQELSSTPTQQIEVPKTPPVLAPIQEPIHTPADYNILNQTATNSNPIAQTSTEQLVAQNATQQPVSNHFGVPLTDQLPNLEQLHNEVKPALNESKMNYEQELETIKRNATIIETQPISVFEADKPKEKKKSLIKRIFTSAFSIIFYIALLAALFLIFETQINTLVPIKTKLVCTFSVEERDTKINTKETYRFLVGNFFRRTRITEYKFSTKQELFSFLDKAPELLEKLKLPGSVLEKPIKDEAGLTYTITENIESDQLNGKLQEEYTKKSYKLVKKDFTNNEYKCN